jgi:hypothetical protein
MASRSPRSAQEVIDQAIRDNRVSEWLLYGFAVTFVLAGLVILTVGVSRGDWPTTGIGAVVSSLFLPAMSSTRRTRKENIAIRLLETSFSKATTAREAAEVLRRAFDQVFTDVSADK